MAVRTSLRSVRAKTTEGQYSPVRLEQARLKFSLLLYGPWTQLNYFEFATFREQNTRLMTVSVEMVRMAKFRPGKNRPERGTNIDSCEYFL